MNRYRIASRVTREVRASYAELPDLPAQASVSLALLDAIDVTADRSTLMPRTVQLELDAFGRLVLELPVSPAKWQLTGPDGAVLDFDVPADAGPLILTPPTA